MAKTTDDQLGFPEGSTPKCASPWCEIGSDRKIAFVLSCPGYDEYDAGRPAAGATGKNLKILLDHLRDELQARPTPHIGAADLYRGKISITNAYSVVHYTREIRARPEHVNTCSQPSNRLVKAPENLERLLRELSGNQYVVPCGVNARYAIEAAIKANPQEWIRIANKIPHVGGRGLIRVSGSSADEKLKFLAHQIAANLRA